MKKILAMLLCVSALLVTGCASTSAKQKLSDDECLIVLRAGTDKENAGAKTGRDYSVHVSEIDQSFRIPGTANRKIVFKINNDKARIDKLIGRIATGFQGQPVSWDLDINLPYSPGKVIPLKFSIVNEVRKTGSNNYSANIEFYEMSEEDINVLYSEIKNDPEYSSWF